MNNKVKRIIGIVAGISVIVLIVVFNFISFIIGPINIQYKKDEQVVLDAIDDSKYLLDDFISKYDYDKTYYTVKALTTSGEKILWISNNRVLEEADYSKLDYQKAIEVASSVRELNKESVILGYFDNQTSYIVTDKNYEIRISFETFEVISIYEKKVRI